MKTVDSASTAQSRCLCREECVWRSCTSYLAVTGGSSRASP